MQKVELLSPAGNFEKLKIALAYGADAVYGGVSHFSLRIRSGKEFTYESFQEAIEYTHSKNKKIYVTINGFPFNNQIKLLGEHIAKMAVMKPDAFIVSTPGVVKLCKQIAPQIPIHLSTQANVLNYLDAEVYYEMGVERIIAAREVSLKDLIKIKEYLPKLEIEIFVHGSMCFAYSGRCLISSVQSGRVPNRGSCANDCRFDYTLYAENPDNGTLFKIEQDEAGTHIMNAKDMNMSAHVDEILKSGVIDSLKIEGRTKSPYYAAVTARTYRAAIDDYFAKTYDAKKYEDELNTTKNRGFSDAYLVQRPYEKEDTQNLETAMSEGSYEVSGLVLEDGEHFMCKYTTLPNSEIEMIMPMKSSVEAVENELGKIYHRDGKWYIMFYQIITNTDKILESVHSGYMLPIKLPGMLPAFTIMRQKS
ncbi:MAG: U32 family peptidase [Epsilonproteobacteria bacterium]|nr:U32 family peptidase [Campylobacterota bacterium]